MQRREVFSYMLASTNIRVKYRARQNERPSRCSNHHDGDDHNNTCYGFWWVNE